MNFLFLLQFASFMVVLINAFILGVAHLHVRWLNKRYERSRWMIFTSMVVLAMHYFMQMYFGFRAMSPCMGSVVNILVYIPSFTLISLGIYNIEATHGNRKRMNIVCGSFYALILIIFAFAVYQCGSLHVGSWIYAMLVPYIFHVVYCIFTIVKEMRKRRNMLETMAGDDILPYVRYARASVLILFIAGVIMPFAILFNSLLYIVGPFALIALLFFTLCFVAFGNYYSPAEEFLDKDEEEREECDIRLKSRGDDTAHSVAAVEESAEDVSLQLSDERIAFIQTRLDQWCADLGYKDSSVNMLTLTRALCLSRSELTQFFDQCQKTTFRIWLSEIRFNAAKKMMLEFPDYSNDVISAECGFSSRSYLYRVFREKEGCTPTSWRENNLHTDASEESGSKPSPY